jgi:hypothetical protein
VDARTDRVILEDTAAAVLSFPAVAGHAYRILPADAAPLPFAPIDGTPAVAARKLGPVQIGLFPATLAASEPSTPKLTESIQ